MTYRTRGSKTDRSKAMKKADTFFSKFIRLRDADEHGYVSCVTCGSRRHWREVDCGHFITRAKQATRYDERNCHAQCKGCNRFQGGKFLEHEAAIDRIHGRGTAEELKRKAMMPCRRAAIDFAHIAMEYKAKANELDPRP